jgi:hypothetical protein
MGFSLGAGGFFCKNKTAQQLLLLLLPPAIPSYIIMLLPHIMT